MYHLLLFIRLYMTQLLIGLLIGFIVFIVTMIGAIFMNKLVAQKYKDILEYKIKLIINKGKASNKMYIIRILIFSISVTLTIFVTILTEMHLANTISWTTYIFYALVRAIIKINKKSKVNRRGL